MTTSVGARVPLAILLVLALVAAHTDAATAGPPTGSEVDDDAPAARWTIEDPGQGIVALRAPGPGTVELSALAWVQGERWLAVSDRLATLHVLGIAVDSDGRLGGASVQPGVPLEGARDPEGLAYAPESATVYVADERGSAIREYAPATGRLLREIPIPVAFATARHNLGLESLSRDPASGVSWTANEEALPADGPRADEASGTLVRLQRFDRDWKPDGQWAWRTAPLRAAEDRTIGVSDLVALPDGGLLVLERSQGAHGFRVALLEAEPGSAPDVQASPALPAGTPALRGHLLWAAATGRFDFEGAALGPPLRDGGSSLVLVADDGRGGALGLYPLVLRPRARARERDAVGSTRFTPAGRSRHPGSRRMHPGQGRLGLQPTGGLLPR